MASKIGSSPCCAVGDAAMSPASSSSQFWASSMARAPRRSPNRRPRPSPRSGPGSPGTAGYASRAAGLSQRPGHAPRPRRTSRRPPRLSVAPHRCPRHPAGLSSRSRRNESTSLSVCSRHGSDPLRPSRFSEIYSLSPGDSASGAKYAPPTMERPVPRAQSVSGFGVLDTLGSGVDKSFWTPRRYSRFLIEDSTAIP